VTAVELPFELAAGKGHFGGVHDDDVVAGVEERGVGGLVLAREPTRGLGREAPDDDVLGVHQEPLTFDVFCGRDEGRHFSRFFGSF
jgi:hypothetical protein